MTDESIVAEVPSAEEVAQHYKAMGHSVDLINAILAGTQCQDDTEEERAACIKRNVGHLEIMAAKNFWTDEDMTASSAAIAAGTV
jgi:hypothetical protein|tara:strand:+ start:2938 stop:3192 length:255 start_codon:yes stop_codon:yes gene_type:complete